MRTILRILFALCLFTALPSGWSDENTAQQTRPLTSNEISYIRELNKVLLVEIQKGIEQLKLGNLSGALSAFYQAINIAPYDPMAYKLLIETLLHSNQEDLAYKILEIAGHSNTDSNIIIKSLYSNLSSIFGPAKEEALPRISIAQFKGNKTCAVSFMFDDGEPSVATAILPMFEEYGWRTSISINPGMIPPNETDPYRAGWGAWRRAVNGGHEIANHGMTHLALSSLSKKQLKEQVDDSQAAIVKNLGVMPRTFVFPEDKIDEQAIKWTRQNHIAIREHDTLKEVYARICIPVFGGKFFSSESGRLLIDMAMLRRLWLIPECHGLFSRYIKDSFKSISPELLHDQLKYMKKNEDKIWVAKFITVFTYLTERKATEIKTLESDNHHIKFELINNLDKKLYFARLTVLINPPKAPGKVTATLLATETWIPASIKDGLIMINLLPNSGPIEVSWE